MKKPTYRQANSEKDLKLNKPKKSWKKDKTLVVLTKRPDGRKWVHHYDPWWVKYDKAKGPEDLKANKPMQSWKKNKKLVVRATKGKGKNKKEKIIHFGAPSYEDYTMHGDPVRRKNYLKRSGGIRDKDGKLTKNDVFSANYWARKYLW